MSRCLPRPSPRAEVGATGSTRAEDYRIPVGSPTRSIWITALARDLAAHRGKSLVIAGETQPAEVHALAHLINHSLGNAGKTVDFIARVDAGPADQIASLRELVRDMNAGVVDTLIILGGNPAYDAPGRPRVRQGAGERQGQAPHPSRAL